MAKIMSQSRIRVSQEQVDFAFVQLFNHGRFRLDQKGNGAFLSSDEYLQIIEQEVAELREAEATTGKDGKLWELLDIAWACVFAIASHEAGGIEDQS